MAVATEGLAHREDEPGVGLDRFPVADLLRMWVDHFGLSVLAAGEALAVQLTASGYPRDTDEVAFAEAVAMTCRVYRAPRVTTASPLPRRG